MQTTKKSLPLVMKGRKEGVGWLGGGRFAVGKIRVVGRVRKTDRRKELIWGEGEGGEGGRLGCRLNLKVE